MANKIVDSPPSEKGKGISETPSGKKKKKPLILIGISFFLILAIAGSLIFLAPGLIPGPFNFLGKKNRSKELKKETPKNQGHLYNMDPFVVNLADSESLRYLKVKMDIESNEKKPNEEYVKKLPQLRDAILTVLSSKNYGEIYDSEGKKRLKEEIILKANQLLGQFKVKTVYFTEFIVQ